LMAEGYSRFPRLPNFDAVVYMEATDTGKRQGYICDADIGMELCKKSPNNQKLSRYESNKCPKGLQRARFEAYEYAECPARRFGIMFRELSCVEHRLE